MRSAGLGLALLVAAVTACGDDGARTGPPPSWVPEWAIDEALHAYCDPEAERNASQGTDADLAGQFDYALLVDGRVRLGEQLSDLYVRVEVDARSITRLDRGPEDAGELPLPARAELVDDVALETTVFSTDVYELQEGTFLLAVRDTPERQVVTEVMLVGANEELVVLGWCDGWSIFERLMDGVGDFRGTQLDLITGPTAEALEAALHDDH